MLHFQDNMSSDSSEDLQLKIRPVFDYMRSEYMKIGSENQFSIDKMTFLTRAKEKPLEVSTQQTQEMVVQDVYISWCVWLCV